MRQVSVVALVLLLIACGDRAPETAAAARAAVPEPGAVDSEARRLAVEVRDLADRIADYAASHRSRPPKRLRDLAVDSLTPETARIITVTDSPRVVVSFRRTTDRVLLSCAGGPALLEEAQLNGGLFHLACRTPRGDTIIAAQELR